jgi:site-specific DNA recombinase
MKNYAASSCNHSFTDRCIRLKAIETIQSLIDHIKVTPTNTGFDVELHGELGAIMEMVGQNDRSPAGLIAGRSLSVVAGVGFEPTTFRL